MMILMMMMLPAVVEDGKDFVVVLVPVLALADEASERGEPRLSALDSDLFTLSVAEHDPVADQLGAKRTLCLR